MYKIEAHIYEEGSDFTTGKVLLLTPSAHEAMNFMRDLEVEDIVVIADDACVFEWSALVQLFDGDVPACTRQFTFSSPFISEAAGWEALCQKEREEILGTFLHEVGLERKCPPVQNQAREEETVMKKECSNSVKRTRHYTVCSGLVRPDPLGEAQRFEGEVVDMWCDTLQAERILKRRFKGAPVIIETMDRRSGTYYMDLSRFYELADRFVETDQHGNVCEA